MSPLCHYTFTLYFLFLFSLSTFLIHLFPLYFLSSVLLFCPLHSPIFFYFLTWFLFQLFLNLLNSSLSKLRSLLFHCTFSLHSFLFSQSIFSHRLYYVSFYLFLYYVNFYLSTLTLLPQKKILELTES